MSILIPDPLNGRLELDETEIHSLAATIRADGLLNPITIEETPTGWSLVAGRRRLAAVTSLGWPRIPCIVQEPGERRSIYSKLVENTARSQLSPVEEALQLAQIIADEPGGVDAIAARIGRRPEWILDRLDMADWPPDLLQAVHTRKLAIGAAKQLVRIEPPGLRTQRIEEASLHGISARTAALWLQDSQIAAQGPPAPGPNLTPGGELPYISSVRAYCFGCHEHQPIETTSQVRICQTCLRELTGTPDRPPSP